MSIGVYVRDEGGVVSGVFQWMRAGWSGLFVVRESHVAESLERYARLFPERLTRLPKPEKLEALHAAAEEASDDALRGWDRDVFTCWLERHGPESHKDALRIMREGYESRSNRDGLVALRANEGVQPAEPCYSGASGAHTSRLSASLLFQPLSTSR